VENIKEAKKALLKKALGFKTKEIVEEYSASDGEIILTKKKVTQKTVPPDCMAIKMLIEGTEGEKYLTDEQLQEEKERLLKLLKEVEDDRKRN
jgi:hypothetical protein